MYERVSVIIPTWNRATHLRAAIPSVLAQTYPVHEILVCDDGSTDESEAVVRSFDDPRLRWLPGPHSGRPAVPRNRGLAASAGEWIAFLDSDDRWVPQKLEQQLQHADNLRSKAACSNGYRSGPRSDATNHMLTWNKPKLTFDDLLYTNYVICSSAMIHRSLVADVIGFPEDPDLTALEDYALWLRIATRTDLAYVAKPLVIYNDDRKQSVRRADPDFVTQKVRVIRDFLRWAEHSSTAPIYKTKARHAQSVKNLQSRMRRVKHFLLHWKTRLGT